MNYREVLYNTSPYSIEDTDKILYKNVFFNEEERKEFFHMLNEDTRDVLLQNFLEEFCSFLNTYIIKYRAPVAYKQVIRDKMEKWCIDIGKYFDAEDEEVNGVIKEWLCVPFKEELTCKMLKALHKRTWVSNGELVNTLGVSEKTVYNEIEKIKGKRGVARIYGQEIQVPVEERFEQGDCEKAHIKKFRTKNTVSPVMLQMNISQTAALLSSLAHAYLNEEKSIARTLGFEVWAQLSDYARNRIEYIYNDLDEELCMFIRELKEELSKTQLIYFQTEMEAYEDLNDEEKLVTLIKTGRKCTITFWEDGKRETMTKCIVEKNKDNRGFCFKGIREDGSKDFVGAELVESFDIE